MSLQPLPTDDTAALKAALAEQEHELAAAREREAATAQVLKVIASSAGELDPVLSAMLANAARLCEASYGAMWLYRAGAWKAVAMHGDLPPAYLERWRTCTWFTQHPALQWRALRQPAGQSTSPTCAMTPPITTVVS